MRILCSSAVLLCLSLTGCTMIETASPVAETGATLQGRLHGGQQPVVGAHIYLFQANTTGAGAASISLLSAASTGHSDSVGAYVLTDNTGQFSISSDYSCTPNTQVYTYALGGNPGAGTNSAAGFMALLGNCPAAGNFASTAPYIWMNEVSTVAAAYSIAGFATDALHVSSSGSSLAKLDIGNAFATAANLVSLSTGVAYTTVPNGGGTVPQATINTLANILASCVNSAGPTSTPCSLLLNAARSAGSSGTVPTDTATAAINIAHYPANSTSILYSVLASSAAFQPALSSAPTDFTLGIVYSGGGISKPDSIAIDGTGNAWIANYNATGVSEILAGGGFAPSAPYTGAGVGASEALAIDTSGNVWVANFSKNSISKLNNAGGAVSGVSGYVGAGLNAPSSLAIDSNGYVWVGNGTRGACISAFTSAGAPVTTTAYNGAGCSGVYGLAIDASGEVWGANSDSSAVTEFYGSTGVGTMGTEVRALGNGGLASPVAVAINSAGNVWVANGGKNAADASYYLASNGQAQSGPSGVTGGGLATPYSVATDGSGNLWFANSASGSISEFTSNAVALSPSASGTFNGGYVNSAFSTPAGIAVDGAGNVWVADQGSSSVIEMIGLGTPVVTPIAAALHTPYTPGSQP